MKWKMSGMREKQKGPLHLIYVPCQGWQFHFVLITNHTSFFATKIEKFLVNDIITVSCHINPLGPKSDQHQISPCNITAL